MAGMTRPLVEGRNRRQTASESGVGVAVGVLLGLLTSLAPIFAILAVGALLIGTWIALARHQPRLAALAGITLGSSLVFLWGVATTVQACSETANFCGDTNVLPLVAFAVVGLATGLIGAIASVRRAKTSSR